MQEMKVMQKLTPYAQEGGDRDVTERSMARNRKQYLFSYVRGGIVKMSTDEKEYIVVEQIWYWDTEMK